jgi:hypothetical protein
MPSLTYILVQDLPLPDDLAVLQGDEYEEREE